MQSVMKSAPTDVIVGKAHGHEVFGWAVVIHLVTSVKH